jgi:indoleamine 2,3-dioxygenase
MLPPIPALGDYGLSPEHGFLPIELPLELLPDPYYNRWEAVVANLQALLLSKRLRGVIEELPILSTSRLGHVVEWRRAYVVLSFLTHAFIWGGDEPEEVCSSVDVPFGYADWTMQRIPPPLAIPYLKVSKQLELPPVATYAAVCLWNFKPIFSDEPIDTLANLSTLTTFTGSLDESWFYLVSVAVETRGAPLIPLMLTAIAASRLNDSGTVMACLHTFAEGLDELGTLLQRMYENCDPHVFYHRIRPFLAGSKNMADAGLPNGVIYEDGSGQETYRQYGGGSNAQSSLIQFFDIVLGVEHRPTGSKQSGSAEGGREGTAPPSRNSFIHDMRSYMPGPHRRFLEHVSTVAELREYVEGRKTDRALCIAFDACLAMLRALRDKHIQMVSRYIIVKSRSHSRSLSPRAAPPPRKNLASAHPEAVQPDGRAGNKNLRGTGGTALIPFLKQARDETGEPAIGAWARRILSNGPTEGGAGLASPGTTSEHTREVEIVGLAGTWTMDDSEGGLCHW